MNALLQNRHVKAQSDLQRWLKKMKFASNKVRKLTLRCRYYEKQIADERYEEEKKKSVPVKGRKLALS